MGGVQVIDPKTGKAHEQEARSAEEGFRTGAVRLPKGVDVALTGDDGVTSYFPAENVAGALDNGFRFADSKSVAELKAEDAPALAFVENFANSATPLPIVHGLERAFGVDPEDMDARARSTAGKLGSGGGVLASALYGGAALTGARTAVGKVVTGAAQNALANTAAQAAERTIVKGVSNEIARKALSAGMGRAVEGATYGVSNALDEAALGRAPLNAETLAANIGVGALAGGLTGGVVGSIAPIGRAIARQATKGATAKAIGTLAGLAHAGPAGALAGMRAGTAAHYALESKAAQAVPALNGLKALLDRGDDYIATRVAKLAGRNAPVSKPPIEAAVTGLTLTMKNALSRKDREEAYRRRVEELSALSDPATYAQHAERDLGDIQHAAPDTAMAYAQQGKRVVDHVLGQVPPSRQQTGDMNAMFRKDRKPALPSDRQIQEFAERDEIAQNPLSILALADRGMVRKTHVDTLKALYPELYTRIQHGLVTGVAEAERKPTGGQRASIKRLLGGEPVTAKQQELRQSVYDKQEPEQGQGLPPPTRAQERKRTSAALTQSQRLEYEP